MLIKKPASDNSQGLSGDFCDIAWQSIADVYANILKHPFINELANGTLPREKFLHYMVQDSLYLVEFARTLAILAARAETPDEMLHLIEASRDTMVVERGLHEGFFKEFGITKVLYEGADKTNATEIYSGFLLSQAYESAFEVAVAAVLPCFWIYLEVGKEIYGKSGVSKEIPLIHRSSMEAKVARGMKQTPNTSISNPYQRWIETYAGGEFEGMAERMRQYVNTLAAKTDARTRAKMLAAFTRSSQLEYVFWDGVYDFEQKE